MFLGSSIHIPPAILGLGTGEWILVFLAVLIIFGVGKIPQIGSGLGKGIKNFRKAVRGDDEEEPGTKQDPQP